MTRLTQYVFFLGIVLHFFFLQSILPIRTLPEQNTVIECIMVETSGCPSCHNTYLTMIKPFYDKYRENGSINFTLIDVYTQEGNDQFILQKNRLNITPSDHASLPWVIFVWNDTQNIELLDETELEAVEATFLSILEALKDNSTTSDIISSSDTNPLSSSDNRLYWLFPSIAVGTLIGIFTGGSIFLIYKYIWKSKP